MTDTSDIDFSIEGGWGIVSLNRPKALNALTKEMCVALDAQLREWAAMDAVKAVLVCTDNEKAFCAGGDIRWLYDLSREDPVAAAEFFRAEYTMNALIHHYPKPYVALVDGICMGGGVGISASASHLVMSDNALWAMPETGIGLFPDVGGSYFLSRLPGGLGLYLALTGHRLSGIDCHYAGIADFLVPPEAMLALREALLSIEAADISARAITGVIEALERHQPSQLDDSRPQIDQYFSAPESMEYLFASLADGGGGFASHTLERLERMSPTSMKIAFGQLQRGADMDFNDCMVMEFAIASRVMEGPDFQEGVRALIVDKDKSPKWSPETIAGVTPDMVARYFAPLGDRDLVL